MDAAPLAQRLSHPWNLENGYNPVRAQSARREWDGETMSDYGSQPTRSDSAPMSDQTGQPEAANQVGGLRELIEAAVSDLVAIYDVVQPPVPIELILQRPKAGMGMWQEVNLSELSTSFIVLKQRYSPRMSIARLLARNICRSAWGEKHRIDQIGGTDEGIRALARALVMPRGLLEAVPVANRTLIVLSLRFEVPEEDARLRLQDLGLLPG